MRFWLRNLIVFGLGIALLVGSGMANAAWDIPNLQALAAIGAVLIFVAGGRALFRVNWFAMGAKDSALYSGQMRRNILGNPFARWIIWIDEDGNDRDLSKCP